VDDGDAPRLWHVTLTVGGRAVGTTEARAALERLVAEQPFLLGGRYADDRVELAYWEEADTVEDAAALALRMWGEHRATAALPAWRVMGVEILQRGVFLSRGATGERDVGPRGGAVRPF